jgi:pseudouridine-5'-phosphate glycosidase
MNKFSEYLKISPEVQNALNNNLPIVALESTIISHGFNWPENLECAKQSEATVRENGAIPATIAILNGKICVGLNADEIIFLAQNRDVPKCSRRDVAAIISSGGNGATTVATTMMFAAMAGIKVFCTGGIGGVHRGAAETFDISADLQELANTNVAVVCAGAKSILDIPLTREYLETFGVPVLGYNTNDFPGFYTRKSEGGKVDYRMDTALQIAKFLKVKEELALSGGVLIANPIPKDAEMDYDFISEKTNEALSDAAKNNIKGKATTPFLLAKLHDITKGKSVEANKALVFNNAKIAAQIAAEYSKL